MSGLNLGTKFLDHIFMSSGPKLLQSWLIAKDYYGQRSILFAIFGGALTPFILIALPGMLLTPVSSLLVAVLLSSYLLWGYIYFKGSSFSTATTVKWGRVAGLGVALGWSFYLFSMAQSNSTHSTALDMVILYNISLISIFPTVFKFDRLVIRTVVGSLTGSLILIGTFKFTETYYALFLAGVIIYCIYVMIASENSYQSDLQLHHQQRRLEQIFDAFPGGVSLLKDLRYTIVNRYLRQNMPKGIDMYLKELGSHAIDALWVNKVIEFHKSADKQVTFEAPVSTNFGARMHLTSATKISNDEMVLTSIDIQDLVEAKGEAEKERARNLANAKLVSLGEMSSGIAHEINNPLAVLKGRLGLLQKITQTQDPKPEKILEHTSKLMPMVERIEKIVKSMRSLSRNGSGDLIVTQTTPKKMIEEALVFMEARLKNFGVNLEIYGDGLNSDMLASESEVTQVILNALANSHDAIQKLDSKWIKVEVLDLQDSIQIKIQDSGSGISPELKDKIGQPFFTTKPPGQGTGLGLSIAKNIIDRHSGKIYFEHQAPHTTLVIVLPKWQKIALAS